MLEIKTTFIKLGTIQEAFGEFFKLRESGKVSKMKKKQGNELKNTQMMGNIRELLLKQRMENVRSIYE